MTVDNDWSWIFLYEKPIFSYTTKTNQSFNSCIDAAYSVLHKSFFFLISHHVCWSSNNSLLFRILFEELSLTIKLFSILWWGYVSEENIFQRLLFLESCPLSLLFFKLLYNSCIFLHSHPPGIWISLFIPVVCLGYQTRVLNSPFQTTLVIWAFG